jgi:hypothetical protein
MRFNCYAVQISSEKHLKIGSFLWALNEKLKNQFNKINNEIKVLSLLFFVFSYTFISYGIIEN